MAEDTTITENIDLAVNGSALDPVFKSVNDQLNKIARKLVEINGISQRGADGVSRKLELELKKVSRTLQQVRTLESLANEQTRQGSRPITAAAQEQALGKRAIAAARYEQNIRNATTAVEALEARQNAMITKGAKLASEGVIPNKAFLNTQRNIERALADLKRLEKAYSDLDAKARAAGGDYSPQRVGFSNALSGLRNAASDGRRSNFGGEMDQVRAALSSYQGALNDASVSPTQALNFRKRQAADEIRAMREIAQVDQARVANQNQLKVLKEQIAAGDARNLRVLHDQLAVEDAKERAIARQTRELMRQNAAPTGSGGGGSNILPAGGVGTVLARTAAYGGAASAIYGTLSALRDGARYIREFEDGLGELQAITGSTDTQMLRLGETIEQVGAGSRFATKDLVEAATVLAQAGMSTSDIAQALESVSQLAAASGSTLQQTTDVVTSALGSFQLGASETARVADVLTASLNNSKLNLEQVALGLQYAGQTAKENNLTFEDLVATLATMSQAGIRSGSTQGTGLRQFLVDLQSPSKQLVKELERLGVSFEDIDVKSRGLPAVLGTLAAKGFDASSAYGALEVRAAAAYLVLKNNTDEIHRQTLAQQQAGLAQEASAKSLNTLSAQWQRFKNILNAEVNEEGAGFFGWLRDQLKGYNDEQERQATLQKELDRLSPGTKLRELGEDTDRASMTMAILNLRFDEARKKWDLAEHIRNLSDELDNARLRQEGFAATLEASKTAIADTGAEIEDHRTKMGSLDEAIASVRMRQGELKDGSLALQAETVGLTGRFEGLSIQLGGTVNTVEQLIGALYRLRDASAAALQNSYLTQVANLATQSEIAKNNFGASRFDMGANLGSGRGAKFVRDQLAIIARGTGIGATDEDRRAAFTAQGVVKDVIGNLRRSNPNDPRILNLTTALGQSATSIQAASQMQQLTTAYGAGEYLRNNPRGRQLEARAMSVMGKSQAEKQKVQAELDAAFRASKDPNERAAITDLANRVISSPTPGVSVRPDTGSSSGATAATNRANRNERFVSRDMLALIEDELKADLDDAKAATTGDLYTAAAAAAANSLDEWEKAVRDVASDEMTSKGIDGGSELGKRYLAQTDRRIAAKKEEVNKALLEVFVDSIEKQLDIIDQTYDSIFRDNEAQLVYLQGRLSGLDRYSLRNRVTDADRILADRDARREQESVDLNRRNFLGTQITEQQAQLGKLEGALTTARSDGSSAQYINTLENSLREVRDRIAEVVAEKGKLDAAFAAEQDLPVTFRQHMETAVAAYVETNNLTRTFTEELGGNLMGVLGSAHGAFGSFFDDLTNGTTSVATAFANMGMSVLKSLQQLASQMLANQLFKILLGLIAPSAFNAGALSASTSDALANIPVFTPGGYYGGPVAKIIGYRGGGRVKNGSRGHDSVYAKLRRDEFVLQPTAADSIGPELLNDMNKRGADALKGLAGNTIINAPQAAPPTNVYVVAPEHKQQMGPQDVLVVLQDDILRNGQTKKLIKAVAAGA